MPIHDWTRVRAGIFHDFHHEWITTIKHVLNAGVLPAGYYAMAEQIAGGFSPDVLALESAHRRPSRARGDDSGGGLALATAPPKVRFTATAEIDEQARRRSRAAIRPVSDDHVVAMLEIVSPGNKSTRHALRSFVEKALELFDSGIHLLVIDLFPPGSFDPQGMHAAIWSEIESDDFHLPPQQPLTLAAYSIGDVKRAFIEPVAIGQVLPEMPLFLEAGRYVPVPLESSYLAAFNAVPIRWQEELVAPD